MRKNGWLEQVNDLREVKWLWADIRLGVALDAVSAACQLAVKAVESGPTLKESVPTVP